MVCLILVMLLWLISYIQEWNVSLFISGLGASHCYVLDNLSSFPSCLTCVPLQECDDGAVKGDGEPGGVYRRVNRELKKVCTDYLSLLDKTEVKVMEEMSQRQYLSISMKLRDKLVKNYTSVDI